MEISAYSPRLCGRGNQLKFLKDKLFLDKVHLLQVYGQPHVGKSYLVWEVLRTMKHELHDELFYCESIILQENESWDKIEARIIQFRNQHSTADRVFVILKNFHLISSESLVNFQEFCCRVSMEDKISIIIIHQRSLEFQFPGIMTEKLQVMPLNLTYSKMLFYEHAYSSQCSIEDEDKYIDYLVNQCSGLPGVIISLALKWKQWSSIISIAEFCDYFRKSSSISQFMETVICPQLCLGESFDPFFKSLPENLKSALAKLSIFPGSLSINDITYMVGERSQQKTKFEITLPLMLHGFIKKEKEKFQVQPLIRRLANQRFYHLYNEDVNRLKFVHLIGNVLLKAEEIYRKNMPKQTLGIVQDNWENIEFLLRQGVHLKSDDKTISVLFKVAVDAGDVISTCCPREAKEFFFDCLNAAKEFGTTEQKAMMQVRYGQSLTNEGGIGGEKNGMLQYQKAIVALKNDGKDFRTLCLLNSMAYNYYRQGHLHSACKCAKEALEMDVKDNDPAIVNHLKINSASIYAYTLIYLGKHEKAKQILHEALENVEDSHHASISVMLNSLGLAEEGTEGNELEALKWYLKSLSMRRQMSILKPENLVIPLCHIADLASKKLQKYDLALKHLNEAKEIMKKKCWIHIHSATIQYTFGLVYLRMQSIGEALFCFEDALKIHKKLHPNHYFNGMVLNWISHCHLLEYNSVKAEQKFEEARKTMAAIIEMRPNVCYLAQPLEHLIRMTYNEKKKMGKYQNELITEIERLINFPGLDKTLISQYKKVLDAYQKYQKSERCVLDDLPMTCDVCSEIKEQNICPLQQYKERVNMVHYRQVLPDNRKPISTSNEYHRPPEVEFYLDAPQLPDPEPDPDVDEPSIHENDEYLSLLKDIFMKDSKVSTLQRGEEWSTTNHKFSDSLRKSGATSSDEISGQIAKTKMSGFLTWNRPPSHGMEHSENDSSCIKPLYCTNPEGSAKDSTSGITEIIFDDQFERYNRIQSGSGFKDKSESWDYLDCSPQMFDFNSFKNTKSKPNAVLNKSPIYLNSKEKKDLQNSETPITHVSNLPTNPLNFNPLLYLEVEKPNKDFYRKERNANLDSYTRARDRSTKEQINLPYEIPGKPIFCTDPSDTRTRDRSTKEQINLPYEIPGKPIFCTDPSDTRATDRSTKEQINLPYEIPGKPIFCTDPSDTRTRDRSTKEQINLPYEIPGKPKIPAGAISKSRKPKDSKQDENIEQHQSLKKNLGENSVVQNSNFPNFQILFEETNKLETHKTEDQNDSEAFS